MDESATCHSVTTHSNRKCIIFRKSKNTVAILVTSHKMLHVKEHSNFDVSQPLATTIKSKVIEIQQRPLA